MFFRGKREKPRQRGFTIFKKGAYRLSLSVLPGVNFTALLAGIRISWPVRGLRPFRALRCTTLKPPKPEMLMASPFLSVPARMAKRPS
jgi:hypothetical protein